MASLVTCSFPRAELTELSYQANLREPLRQAMLDACFTNRKRAGVLADAAQNGYPVVFDKLNDEIAFQRITNLLKNSRDILRQIEFKMKTAFRRLYRQRNMILHAGKTDSIALRTTLRTVAPLVGAGMDRIAHASYVQNLAPMELAVKARISLDSLGLDGAPNCLDLLDPIQRV